MMIEIDELEYKSLKLDKEGLLSLLDYKEQKIETLKSKLKNFESIQRGKCCECESVTIQELSDMHFKTMPFEDDYFNGLTYKDIAELAKKSIRLTAENRRLEEEIEKLRGEKMTDKQIIIDGVDVRGCKNFSCGICEEENKIPRTINHFTADCRMYPNCNYKQLKRKEQECEELKKTSCKFKNYCTCDIENLLQTLTEIKEIAEPYKMTIKKICRNCKKYDDCHSCCYKDINCYKYTSSGTNACEEFTFLDEFVPNILANNILQKIGECEVENAK